MASASMYSYGLETDLLTNNLAPNPEEPKSEDPKGDPGARQRFLNAAACKCIPPGYSIHHSYPQTRDNKDLDVFWTKLGVKGWNQPENLYSVPETLIKEFETLFADFLRQKGGLNKLTKEDMEILNICILSEYGPWMISKKDVCRTANKKFDAFLRAWTGGKPFHNNTEKDWEAGAKARMNKVYACYNAKVNKGNRVNLLK